MDIDFQEKILMMGEKDINHSKMDVDSSEKDIDLVLRDIDSSKNIIKFNKKETNQQRRSERGRIPKREWKVNISSDTNQ